MNPNRTSALLLTLVFPLCLIAGLFPASAQPARKPIKAGFIYPSPANDAGWSHSHDLGRQAAAKMPGVTTDFVESIREDAYVESVLTHMAENKYDVIFATSFGYIDAVHKVAPKYPGIIFMHCSGYLQAKNVGTYFGKIHQARYLTGLTAGAMTKTGVLGYVAAYPIPEVIAGINAFTVGARESNPGAKVLVRWTKSWHDPEKEKSSAEDLIDNKADVLTQHQDSPATQITAQKRGVYSIGYNQDMSAYAPKAHLTSAVWRWEVVYRKIIEDIQAGRWKSEKIWWGMDKGLVDIAPFGPMVGPEVRAKVEARRKDIINGSFDVFRGPLKDQTGAVKIPKGKTLTNDELLGMNWFVEGVVGSANP